MYDHVPSGEQWTIAAGEHRAAVVEVGGGLRGYEVAGRPYLDGYRGDEIAPSGAGQVLAPWPNRLRDGSYRFDGASHQLALSEPAAHNASHGLVRWLPWRRVDGTGDSVTVEVVLPPQPGYPWPLRLRTVWTVGGDGLRADHEAINLGDRPAPFGLGTHPYLMVPGIAVDDLTLHVPASSRLLVDARKLPVGEAKVTGSEYDFTSPRGLAGARLDTTFGDLGRDADGRSTVTLRGAGGGVQVWADRSFSWWQLFTGDDLPGGRARRAVAVEPMTCPPDALRSGRDLVVIGPGEIWRGSWGIRPLTAS